jgi:hypothetical protein
MEREEFRALMSGSMMSHVMLKALYRVMCCDWSVVAAAEDAGVYPSNLSAAVSRVWARRMPSSSRWKSVDAALDEWLDVRVLRGRDALEAVDCGSNDDGTPKTVDLPLCTASSWLREDFNSYIEAEGAEPIAANVFGRMMSLRKMRTLLDAGQSVYVGLALRPIDESRRMLEKLRTGLHAAPPADCKDDLEA